MINEKRYEEMHMGEKIMDGFPCAKRRWPTSSQHGSRRGASSTWRSTTRWDACSPATWRRRTRCRWCAPRSFDGIAVKSAAFANGMPDTSSWKPGVDYVRADTGDDFPDAFDAVVMIEKAVVREDGSVTFDDA